ncbi:hypothetical protein ACQEVB_35225 [Pseudonocardia sp. CA-107938]|uniref:hypothetical protein n=1 Tax=Pseudonocardia sp. CA-107938 TaxID=3240021 RepID=UPI003D8C8F08
MPDRRSAMPPERRKVRVAVVVVHGMGEQRPRETLDRFTDTALARDPVAGERVYYSRPALLTGSYEARRHLAVRLGTADAPARVQTEVFEYHWSYLMTGNRLGDLVPTTLRLLVRRPAAVPAGLQGVWWMAWGVAALAVVLAVVLWATGLVGALAAVLAVPVVAVVAGAVLRFAAGRVTTSFVDVVRYLDTSPRSYAARRDIRAGMVDLLRALHADGGYSRIVVVAHSLGAFIAYDGLTSFWTEVAARTAGPRQRATPLVGLRSLERAAARRTAGTASVAEFQRAQFALWQGLRRQGCPWLVTDLLTIGTPMAFADLLLTRDRAAFDRLVGRAELPTCPPRSRTATVDGPPPAGAPRYGWFRDGRQVLDSAAPFAATRWTNLWFPVDGLRGDWFGGPLQQLYGPGVRDVAVTGNLPGRRAWGVAHGRYFDYPEATGPDDVATHVRAVLDLGPRTHDVLRALLAVPPTSTDQPAPLSAAL